VYKVLLVDDEILIRERIAGHIRGTSWAMYWQEFVSMEKKRLKSWI